MLFLDETLNSLPQPKQKLNGKLTQKKIKEWESASSRKTIFENSHIFLKRGKANHVWYFKYKLADKKQRGFRLGKYSENGLGGFSIQDVRRLYVYKLLPMIDAGINPQTEFKKSRIENTRQSTLLFRDVYKEWKEISDDHYKSERGRRKVELCFINHVLPKIGDMSPASISQGNIINGIFKPLIKAKKYETARKIGGYLSKMWKDMLFEKVITENVMPNVRVWLKDQFDHCDVKGKSTSFRAIVHWTDLGDYLVALDDFFQNDSTKRKTSKKIYYCLLLLIHTAVRCGNAVSAKWSQFDLDSRQKYWLIPKGELKKSKYDFKIPLSKELAGILLEYRTWCQSEGISSEWLFPTAKPKSPKSSGHVTVEAIEKYCRKTLGFKGRVVPTPPDGGLSAPSPHGFRSSFCTLCGKHHPQWGSVIEACCSHETLNSVQQRYIRRDENYMFYEKKEVFSWWSEMLMKCKKDQREKREHKKAKKKNES